MLDRKEYDVAFCRKCIAELGIFFSEENKGVPHLVDDEDSLVDFEGDAMLLCIIRQKKEFLSFLEDVAGGVFAYTPFISKFLYDAILSVFGEFHWEVKR